MKCLVLAQTVDGSALSIQVSLLGQIPSGSTPSMCISQRSNSIELLPLYKWLSCPLYNCCGVEIHFIPYGSSMLLPCATLHVQFLKYFGCAQFLNKIIQDVDDTKLCIHIVGIFNAKFVHCFYVILTQVTRGILTNVYSMFMYTRSKCMQGDKPLQNTPR